MPCLVHLAKLPADQPLVRGSMADLRGAVATSLAGGIPLHASPDAPALLNSEGEFTMVNQRWEKEYVALVPIPLSTVGVNYVATCERAGGAARQRRRYAMRPGCYPRSRMHRQDCLRQRTTASWPKSPSSKSNKPSKAARPP